DDGRTAQRRIQNFRAAISIAARDEDPAISKKRRRVSRTRNAQRWTTRKSPGRRIKDLSRRQRASAVAAAGDQDASIRKQSGGMVHARHAHVSRRGERSRSRIEYFRPIQRAG